jgi:hypothetical protein
MPKRSRGRSQSEDKVNRAYRIASRRLERILMFDSALDVPSPSSPPQGPVGDTSGTRKPRKQDANPE